MRTKRPNGDGLAHGEHHVTNARAGRSAVEPTAMEQLGGSNGERLSSMDNLFLLSEGDYTHMHVAITAIFDSGPLMSSTGGVDLERIRAYIHSRLHLIPRYRQRLVQYPLTGPPRWVDDDHFDLDYHVCHTSLPRPGTERQLRWLAGSIKSQQLDRTKPLWETWIVEGLEGGRFAMITKAHHCMIDGMSGAALLEVLLQPEPQTQVEPAPPFQPRPAPGRLAVLREEVKRRVRAPLELASRLVQEPGDVLREVGDGLSAVADLVPLGLHRASETPINGPLGPHRRFDWLTTDLNAVKEIKNRLGGTVNDVVLATVAGALRHFLQGRDVDVSGLDFRALVPVSLRTNDEKGTLGNRVTAWIMALPLAQADARQRLAAVSDTTTTLKQSGQGAGVDTLLSATEWTGSALLSAAIQLTVLARPFNLVVTNVPGPAFPLYLLGARMVAVYPQVPLFANQNLGIALFSYDGMLHWGLNADRDQMPDLHDVVHAIEESFAELCAAAGVKKDVVRLVDRRHAHLPALLPRVAAARTIRERNGSTHAAARRHGHHASSSH